MNEVFDATTGFVGEERDVEQQLPSHEDEGESGDGPAGFSSAEEESENGSQSEGEPEENFDDVPWDDSVVPSSSSCSHGASAVPSGTLVNAGTMGYFYFDAMIKLYNIDYTCLYRCWAL